MACAFFKKIQSFQSSGFFLKSGNLEASGFSAGFSSGHDLWSDFRILKKCLPTVVFFTLVNCKLPSANLVKIDCALYVSPTSQSVPHWSALITRCAIWRENRQCTHGVLFLAWVEAMTWPWLRPSSHHCALYGIVGIGRSTLTIKMWKSHQKHHHQKQSNGCALTNPGICFPALHLLMDF